MDKEILAIIIPTKDRPLELRRLLGSISKQDTSPAQIVVVDGSSAPVKDVLGEFTGLRIDYVRKVPASLTVQRNAGIRAVEKDVTLVAFLDDDVVLEEESLKNMVRFWKSAAPAVAGASFNNMSDAYRKANLLERIFLVNSDRPGRILRSGFQSKLCSLTETVPVEWLVGCAMVFRRSIFGEFLFDEAFSGYARYEDVDFSYRVGRRYRMFVIADAKVKHLSGLEDTGFSAALGEMEVTNRLYFVKKNHGLSVILCYWALFGLFFNNVIKGLMRADRRYMKRAKGNAKGFMRALFNK